MKPAKQDNPFTPGTGHSPPLLAGRDEETRLLALMLDRLNGPRTAEQAKLAREPFPPIKIVGPRGAGKTALLGWTKKRAKQQNIRFVTCERLKQDKGQDAVLLLLRDIAGPLKNALSLIKGFGFNVAGKAGASMELHQANVFFTKVTEAVVKKEPLLLLLDEVHHYDLAMLAWLLQGSQKLIAEGYPLGVVLAGTPGLDSHLDKAESTFIVRSEEIYINALSDAATRGALLAPFEKAGVKMMPAALKTLAAQTDNYPFFIQVVGRAAWDEMAASGREVVDARLVARIKERTRARRHSLYAKAYREMRKGQLMPYARQVMKLLDRNGGRALEDDVIEALVEANAGVDGVKAEEIYVSLCEDGFIWTDEDETVPGFPSFFDYCKDRHEKKAGKPSSGRA